MTMIYLIRHAQAAGNIKHRFQGRADSDLTPLGYEQLDFLAQRGKELAPDVIFTSPLRRAAETAKAFNRFVGAPLFFDEALLEIDGGNWEGKDLSVFEREDPVQADHFLHTPGLFQAPGGEAMANVYCRMSKKLKQIVELYRNKTICIVSHGCALGALITFLQGVPVEEMTIYSLSHNTGITTVTEQGGVYRIVRRDDLSHLPARLHTGFSASKGKTISGE